MNLTLLPKALALSVLTTGLSFAGAQQAQPAPPAPDSSAPQQTAPMGRHHHAPDPARQARHLAKQLNLTPDQTSKIQPILADREQKMDALRQNTALSEQDRHQQMRSIMQDTEQQMAGVLTPDQLTQLKAMHHGRHGHHGGPDDNGASAPAPTQQPS